MREGGREGGRERERERESDCEEVIAEGSDQAIHQRKHCWVSGTILQFNFDNLIHPPPFTPVHLMYNGLLTMLGSDKECTAYLELVSI